MHWRLLPFLTVSGLSAATLLAVGCASPGQPKAPSLYLPAAVKDLRAERVGAAVELHFTVPQRTTDDLPLKTPALGMRVCREVASGPCTVLAQFPNSVSTRNAQGGLNALSLTDTLPAELAAGAPRLMVYRVQLINQRGKPGPYSEAAYAAAGRAPGRVDGFTASGTRLGVLLSWAPAAADGSEVLLRREAVNAPAAPVKTGAKNPLAEHHQAAELLLRASEDRSASKDNRTLDTGAATDVLYRYTAWREAKATIGGRTLTLRSEATLPVAFTLHDTFPPPTPTDLTAAAFTTGDVFTIDLIWQPVEDPGLAGYNVYREAAGEGRKRLNAAPLGTPAFHDVHASPTVRYRYFVTSIDQTGNESAPVSASVEPGS